MLYVKWDVPTGATGTTLTVSYTNQAGTAGRSTSVAFPASPVLGQMLYVPLAAGDTGIRSVQSGTLAVSTGTVGDFGFLLIEPLNTISVPAANIGNPAQSAYDTGFAKIDNNACLFYYMLCTTTNTGNVIGDISLALG